MASIDLDTPSLKQDIIKLIAQYLQDEGFTATKTVLEDEAGIKMHEKRAEHAQFKSTGFLFFFLRRECVPAPVFSPQYGRVGV